MISTRITQQMLVNTVLADIHNAYSRLAETQKVVATGKRINAPSDDPVGAARAVDLRSSIASTEQFMANVREAETFASESESVLNTVIDYMQRARELTIQGATDTINQEQKDIIALEINEILEAVVDLANTQSNGRYIFAGTRTSAAPFETTVVGGEITAVSYVGNSERFSIYVSPGVTVDVNEPGDEVFQSAQDIFQNLIGIRDDLRAGDVDSLSNVRLAELNTLDTQVLGSLAQFGAKMNRLENVEYGLEDLLLSYQTRLSETEDADFAEALVQLSSQENALEAALYAGAHVLQPTLLDFIA